MAASWQLRDYRIEPGHMSDFLAAWTAGVLPLRRARGFTVAAWRVEGEDRFVWVLGWPGPGTFEEADEAYFASPERGAVDPDPAPWIAAKEVRSLTAVA
jgi:hypothetical protein